MSIINRITTWVTDQLVTSSALNGEFNNIINFLNNVDAASTAWDNVKTTTLTVTGNATVAGTWSSAGAKLDLIGNMSASNSASVSFTSLLGSSYMQYIVIIDALIAATTSQTLQVQLSAGSGFVITNYTDEQFRFTTVGSANTGTIGGTSWTLGPYTDTQDATNTNSWEFKVYNPSSGNTNKKMSYVGHCLNASTVHETVIGSGVGVFGTGVVDGIKFFMSSGNITSGTFYLYGIRNS